MRYTARFSNGTVATRTSQRTYSHAYLVVRQYADGKTRDYKGFSRSQQLAEKERNYYAAGKSTASFTAAETLFSEVVAVEVAPK